MRIPFDPGSRRPRPLAVDERASVWPGCHPTGALTKAPQALPVGLHRTICFGEGAEAILPPLNCQLFRTTKEPPDSYEGIERKTLKKCQWH